MHRKASFCCLLISFLTLNCNDARLIPSQNLANKPLTIDSISVDNLPIRSANDAVLKRQVTSPLRAAANTTVCYPLVGCFDNNEPFNNAGLEVPQSPEFVDTAFLFFTQETPTNPEFLFYDNDDSIRNADINPSRWLRIIIHGFTNNRESVWMKKLKNELLKLTNIVPLKNDSANCFRYLLIIARAEKQQMEGCFKITSYDRRHIFKPINVRTLWNAYQSLHMLFNQARRYKGITYHWLEYYRNKRIRSNPLLSPQMANDEDIFRTRIYCKLKEIMLQVNLDEVTTKFLHEQLENAFEMSLSAYKHYIDNTMLEIFAQRDKATQILPYLYLGSQWNASDFEELKFKNIAYILNISDEIDNFFPEHFTYMNIRVYDNENVDLLKEWKKTFQFINKAKMNHRCCLVHCKMGVSRSASTVNSLPLKLIIFLLSC
ncbi:hypothetical protein I4U23_024152 [Adineta vaga]|nr:hypothetical protein I4U23_024152 [Adineta vaga]